MRRPSAVTQPNTLWIIGRYYRLRIYASTSKPSRDGAGVMNLPMNGS